MTLEEQFPMRYCINLDRRPDRLAEVGEVFAAQGLVVERLPAADGMKVRNRRGQGVAGQYACQLSHRILFRKAWQAGVETLLVFEDDVGLCPDFRQRVETMRPPEDWGILVFGCTHVKPPVVVDREWVAVRHFWGTHAYAVRRRWLPLLMRELRKPAPVAWANGGVDNAIARLAPEIPTYAPLPNWAWQRDGYSDLMKKKRKTYSPRGWQLREGEVLRAAWRVMKKMRG